MPPDKLFDVANGCHKSLCHLGMSTGKGQSRRQNADQHGTTCKVVHPLRQLRQIALRHLHRITDNRHDLTAGLEKVGAIEIAETFQIAPASWLAFGNSHQQIVTHELTNRAIRGNRSFQTPGE